MKIIEEGTKSAYHHTPEEIRDLMVSVLALGFAFTVALFGGGDRFGFILQPGFITFFIATTALVGISMLAKELAQKGIARTLESHAKYELWEPGTIIAVLSSFIGVVFAAVSGMVISSEYAERFGRWRIELTPQQMGLIAATGPLMSLALAMAFLMLAPLAPGILPGHNLLTVGARINTFIAAFSLVPANPVDGAKVLRWRASIWIFILLMTLAVGALAYGIL